MELGDGQCDCEMGEILPSGSSSIAQELRRLEKEKESLEVRISSLRMQLEAGNPSNAAQIDERSTKEGEIPNPEACVRGLTPQMVHRYSRHLLLPSFGVRGCLGIVDGDNVELNNLQRQVIHTEAYVGELKVKSAAAACRSINSTIRVVEHREALLPSNALDILSQYDIIVDATDNLPSRYMISDCCVVLDKPLVSGAALGLEGQLTVYHYNGGPCYRCLFPTPAPAAACQRCSDSGVLGVVPGIIGSLQALEAIKVATSCGEPLSSRMLLFDALSGHFRTVKLRGRSLNCEVCGDNSRFTKEVFQYFDYENFTRALFFPPSDEGLKLLMETDRINTAQYKALVDRGDAHVLIDVRPAHHFEVTALANSISVPLSCLEVKLPVIHSAVDQIKQEKGVDPSLYVICRRGNDSQRAVRLLHHHGFSLAKDIIGGLESWAKDIDYNFPMY
ncbi:co-factor for nitrate, reductase and xanthine dehydrogenase 5 isoform X2 [Wolffia australiana]